MDSQPQTRWTAVALSGDVPAGIVVPALAPAGALALWRSQSGRLVAVADRCPHRGMRLSHGFVRGEALSCIYHGWSYGVSGHCRRIPAHPGLVPPDAVKVDTHQVGETAGVIWVRTNAPADDEASRMPPAFDGFEALRSIAVAAGPAAIATAAGAEPDADGLIRTELAGQRAGLLVSPQDGQSLVILLVEAAADIASRIAMARALETVRRTAEAWRGESEAA